MQLNVKRNSPHAVMPTYATEGSACFDIYAIAARPDERNNAIYLETGLVFEIPEGYALMIYSRSGQGFKNDTRLSNCVGIIDSDYTGEVAIKLVCDRPTGEYPPIDLTKAQAQAMLVPVPRVVLTEVDTVKKTARGANGFGSTDNKKA
ncbi:deoxyuridine 5'-triphosphate nucleotidohydrolase [Escherichia phage Skarpretter]|uniref:dUTP diphosphatase n=1 Tax=Escherichia phage Skarpretter TaxID=2488654 RepID=A0A3G8F2T5_9CAUD|nr:deoxyuridine 5'-triphosphate nucleotidohydrolase [Escherichia phage Skarpretter]AZF88642.1 deoxyuridine 5'-triphosphate nucleotidohydrolase [Escherichia phage Skarpretter]